MSAQTAQCCYTNTDSRGWNTVAVSPCADVRALENCKKLQVALSGNRTSRDEKGVAICNLDICGNGDYIFILMTQYGLKDHLGRDNMFSHAYLLDGQTAAEDPNRILRIREDCFKSNAAEAEDALKHLRYERNYDLTTAMRCCGLKAEFYSELIQCVYARLAGKIPEPLYIPINRDPEVMKALLYCIYIGLPIHLRKKLTASLYDIDTAKDRHLIFSEPKTAYAKKFDLSTGENDILTDRIRRKYAKQKFITYFTEAPFKPDRKDYFKNLDKKAQDLGGGKAYKPAFLQAAHYCLNHTVMNDMEDLDSHLWKLLDLEPENSDVLNIYLQDCLTAAIQKAFRLSEAVEKAFDQRIDAGCTSKELTAVFKKYQNTIFLTLPEDEAVTYLQNASHATAQELVSVLLKREEDAKAICILDGFYYEKLNELHLHTLKDLTDFAENCQISKYPKTTTLLSNRAIDLYQLAFDQGEQVDKVLDEYDKVLDFLPNEDQDKLWNQAVAYFWTTLDMSCILFDERMIRLYQLYQIPNDPKSEFLVKYAELPGIFKLKHSAFFKQGAQLFLNNTMHLTEAEIEAGKERLLDSLIDQLNEAKGVEKNGEEGKKQNVERWLNWFELIFAMRDQSELDCALNLYACAEGRQEASVLFNAYKNLIDILTNDGASQDIIKLASEITVRRFIWCDKMKSVVSLEIWLTLSRYIFGNAFELFDHFGGYVPQVLKQSECSEPEILLQYQTDEKDYVSYQHGKKIHQWISLAKKRNKIEKRANRINSGGGFLGFLNISKKNGTQESSVEDLESTIKSVDSSTSEKNPGNPNKFDDETNDKTGFSMRKNLKCGSINGLSGISIAEKYDNSSRFDTELISQKGNSNTGLNDDQQKARYIKVLNQFHDRSKENFHKL